MWTLAQANQSEVEALLALDLGELSLGGQAVQHDDYYMAHAHRAGFGMYAHRAAQIILHDCGTAHCAGKPVKPMHELTVKYNLSRCTPNKQSISAVVYALTRARQKIINKWQDAQEPPHGQHLCGCHLCVTH